MRRVDPDRRRGATGDPAADARWRAGGPGGRGTASCSGWWEATPALPGHRVGLVGHYQATDPAAGRQVLDRACEDLAARGCTLAVGPIDGSTGGRYRLVVTRGAEPPFFLEPDNPDDWPDHFRAAGFRPLAGYRSALAARLDRADPHAEAAGVALADRGIRVRPLDAGRFARELAALQAVAAASFAGSFLYTPAAARAAGARYRLLRGQLHPELVLIAEERGEPVAFAFAVPDRLQEIRGQPIDTVILKTLAVRPERQGLGLGGLLMARCHATAHRLGFTRVIHALMREASASSRLSRRQARTIRRYTLFARPLRS